MFDNPIPCIVELFGHNQIAGRVSEQSVGGASFVRVDVPEVDGIAGFTKLYGASAIYAITPTDEATMIKAVKAFRTVPIETWKLALPEPVRQRVTDYAETDFDNDDEDDDPEY